MLKIGNLAVWTCNFFFNSVFDCNVKMMCYSAHHQDRTWITCDWHDIYSTALLRISTSASWPARYSLFFPVCPHETRSIVPTLLESLDSSPACDPKYFI